MDNDVEPDPTLTFAPATDGTLRSAPELHLEPHQDVEPPFPLRDWGRYKGVRFLGQGGMGQVFLAYDLHLRRNVALKFVRGDDAEHVRRLLVEARAQARVEHERVCQVHEVGEVQGRPYIAMQYIDGVPLKNLAASLTVEQKVLVLRDAAEGVHAAHRAGLIHRDLKPSNILVERTDDGRLKPYVMDFGLAHDWSEKGATASGSVLGTPHYMAPEQARGEVGQLDRRADVYSLGATLYAVLTGEPPITGSNALEVISNIMTVEPRPLRAVKPNTPADLEAIILKCLEKERSARYDSARALIEDLDRFLSGEPVQARSPGLWYRLRKKACKHQLVVSVAAVAFLTVALALGWVAYTRQQATRREQLVRSFTERLERIEARARYSGLSPLHDARSEREALRKELVTMAADIEQGGLDVGAASYAVGRGLLALGDREQAHEHLEASWRSGLREPRFAYTRALVLGHLYSERLVEVERLDDAALRARSKEALRRELLEPLLESLALSQSSPDVLPAYVEALVAFYREKDYDALFLLDSIEHVWPWFYEGALLRADVLRARAVRLWHKGELEEARSVFSAGRRAYSVAAELGQSVLDVYLAQAELEHSAMLMEIHARGDPEKAFLRGLQAVECAHRAFPDEPEVYLLRARLHRRFAEYQLSQKADAESTILAAILAVRTAANLVSDSTRSRQELRMRIQSELARCTALSELQERGEGLRLSGPQPEAEDSPTNAY